MNKKNVTPAELEEEIMKDFEAFFRAIADESSERIIHNAPVESGALRASIRAGVNSEPIIFNENQTDPSGESAIAANKAIIMQAKLGDAVNIVVGAPYGKIVEEGSATMAPHGFMKRAGESLKAIIATATLTYRTYRK